MLEFVGLMLQTAGIRSVPDFLNFLEEQGFFQYVLPFLLIFAIVYAILTNSKILGDNKGASALIAVAIALLSLQLNFVPAFFQNIFPKFGIGLSILLIALILAGAFITDLEKKETYKWIFFGLGALIFIIITILSLSDFNFAGSWWWNQYGSLMIVLVIIIVAVILVIVGSKKTT